jgi:hypothetical protein
MRFQSLLILAGIASLPGSYAITAKSYTGWDWYVFFKPGEYRECLDEMV